MKKSARFLLVAIIAAVVSVNAETLRERYDAADYSINEGNGYKEYNNETATLAWGESYIMMSYIAAYEGTLDTAYLDKLCDHADHVLANRDDNRGVADYRGISGACWRNLHYQPNDEPYCYAVHSGMITYPMAAFVRIIRENPALHELTTYDGMTYLEKADLYSEAAYETIDFHEDQWVDDGNAGYYIFRPDATFLGDPGRDLPLNQGNALGRTIIALGLAEDDDDLLNRARRMARWFDDQLLLAPFDQAYLWNYWGGFYLAPGEDISHAAINVDFARLCGEVELVFNTQDLDRFANTFSRRIYFSNEKIYDHIGGSGSFGNPSYTKQIGRWLGYTPYDSTVYCVTRNFYDALDPTSANGSVVLGFGNVLRYDLPEQSEWYFTMDGWSDEGDYRVPTSENAGIYFIPSSRDDAMKIAMTYEADSRVNVRQEQDGEGEIVARFTETVEEPRTLFFAYHPEWLGDNEGYGALFIVSGIDKLYEGDAVPVAPEITSVPLTMATVGNVYTYQIEADGTSPIHYSATIDDQEATIEKLSGLLHHTFELPGEYTVVVQARNTGGEDEQEFNVTVAPSTDDDTTDDDTTDDDMTDDDTVDDDTSDDDTSDDDIDDDDTADDDVSDDDAGDDDATSDDDDDDDGCGC